MDYFKMHLWNFLKLDSSTPQLFKQPSIYLIWFNFSFFFPLKKVIPTGDDKSASKGNSLAMLLSCRLEIVQMNAQNET